MNQNITTTVDRTTSVDQAPQFSSNSWAGLMFLVAIELTIFAALMIRVVFKNSID